MNKVIKRWQLLVLSLLVIFGMVFTVLPMPVQIGQFGAGVASAETVDTYSSSTSPGNLTNGTGTFTGSPITLAQRVNTIACTVAGTATIDLAAGMMGTAESGTMTLTGSPVTLVVGSNVITTTGATGNIKVTVGFAWTCPSGVVAVQAEVRAAGAGGGYSSTSNTGTGGGGGGAYSKATGIAVVAGTKYIVVVGKGGTGGGTVAGDFGFGAIGGQSYFKDTSTVQAGGGIGGSPASFSMVGGVGGTVGAGSGYSGGAGGNGAASKSGGGGEGAGSTATGGAGTKSLPGLGGSDTDGGDGGNGGSSGGTNGVNGNAPGGGGGGAYKAGVNRNGGNGAEGKVVLTYNYTLIIATLAATSITTTSATLNGNVTEINNGGNVTSYGFVLSTSAQSNPGNVSPSVQTTYTAGNWTWTGVNYGAGQTFDSDGNVTGLTSYTTYYFRAAGYNTYGWVYGDELTLFVSGSPLRKSFSIKGSSVGAQANYTMEYLNVCKWSNTAFVTDFGMGQPNHPSLTWPPAVTYNGKTYIAWQGGRNVDPYIDCYDHTTDTWNGPVLVGASLMIDDGHSPPVIVFDDSGYIHVFIDDHGGTEIIRHWKSPAPETITGTWTLLTDISVGGTYRNVWNVGGVCYLFYRNNSAITRGQICYIKSTAADWNSWTGEDILIDAETGGCDYYGNIVYDSINGRFGIAWDWRRATGETYRMHMYFAWFKISSGNITNVNSSWQATPGANGITTADQDSYLNVIPTDFTDCPSLHLDANGYPHMMYPTCVNGGGAPTWSTSYHKHIYWTGSAWSSPEQVTTANDEWNFNDFVINADTTIDAYVVSNTSMRSGDIEKWHRTSGGVWSKTSTILAKASVDYGLNNPIVVKDWVTGGPRLIFCEIDDGVYTHTCKLFLIDDSDNAIPGYGVITTDGHCADDFGDLRITDSGGTLQNFWIKSFTSGKFAKLAIECAAIPASPDIATFYLCYSGAGTTTSNIKTAYIQGDDFSDNSIDTGIWTETDPNSRVSESGGQLLLANPHSATRTLYTDRLTALSGATSGIVSLTATLDWTTPSTNEAYGGLILNFNTSPDSSIWLTPRAPDGGGLGHYGIYILQNGSTVYENNLLIDKGNLVRIEYNFADNAITCWYWSVGAWVQMSTTQTYNLQQYGATAYPILSMGDAAAFTGANPGIVDTLTLRRRVSPEPTWGALGTEESIRGLRREIILIH